MRQAYDYRQEVEGYGVSRLTTKHTVFYKHPVKVGHFLCRIIGFQQNCDFEGLGEEKEHTDTPTDARINRLGGGWWWEEGDDRTNRL